MTWQLAQPLAAPLRFAIFVGEQNVPAGIELDDQDANCVHAVAFDVDGKAIGTGRLLPDGHIGRMAVVMDWRRRGIGAEILQTLTEEARQRGHAEIKLSAQLQAMEFYRAHGYVAEGKVYEEAGILHQAMRKQL
ncbi:MAG: GNAT family N-acetyltransferase [Betaproteobacteria bacterium]|nr:GNAT family N-acetyltransferase [Betaproteobacteria bacterium]MSQ89004.1 GNAT family N-acetyltransferase [Betaproteobacteria bacterium]